MESTNLRKWLQVLDVAKEIEFGYRSYASLEQLACGHRRISGRRFSQPISVKRSDGRKYVCVRREQQERREQQGSLEEYRTWDKSQQQKSRNISFNVSPEAIKIISFWKLRI